MALPTEGTQRKYFTALLMACDFIHRYQAVGGDGETAPKVHATDRRHTTESAPVTVQDQGPLPPKIGVSITAGSLMDSIHSM